MPITKTVIKISEDCVGSGTDLGFPNMSSCTAVVCVLDNLLIGAHFTMDRSGNDQATTHLCGRISQAIGGNAVHRLLIVGWNSKHNPVAIKNHINCNPTKSAAYDISGHGYGFFKSVDYTVFLNFSFVSADAMPTIWLKRDSKVSKQDDGNQWQANWLQQPSGQRGGYNSSITTQNTHSILRRHFTQL